MQAIQSQPSKRAAPGEALDEYLADRRPRLVGIVLKFGIPAQDAEDLVQQALIAYLYKRDQVRDPDTWLAGAVRRECLQYLRSRQRRLYDAIDSALLDAVAAPQPAEQDKNQLLSDLGTAIRRTPGQCRTVLRMRYGLGCENTEIASTLGYQVSSVRKVATRCLAALCRQMLFTGARTRQRAS
ncbi:MAG TPA: sigma-70 family RNA polymerase sigma factor [Thermoanaerobaculia bacterium]|nr:sigma-70 family RNA polymerase sigma factor [Thermoanaerobaculia bacterium]